MRPNAYELSKPIASWTYIDARMAPEWMRKKFTLVGNVWRGTHNGKPIHVKPGDQVSLRKRGHVTITRRKVI